MRNKVLLIMALAVLLLSGCHAAGPEATEPPALRTGVVVDWKEFTLTNDRGQQLVMDLSETDYPEGDMPRGDVTPAGSGTGVTLSFDVPASSFYELECAEGEFYFGVVGDYGASARGDRVTAIRLSDGAVSLTGRDTEVRLSLSAEWELDVQGHTDSTATMTRSGDTITIEGLSGDYKFWATDLVHSGLDSYAIEGTARTGTLTVDLSRLDTEWVITITDGDVTTEHEVKKP